MIKKTAGISQGKSACKLLYVQLLLLRFVNKTPFHPLLWQYSRAVSSCHGKHIIIIPSNYWRDTHLLTLLKWRCSWPLPGLMPSSVCMHERSVRVNLCNSKQCGKLGGLLNWWCIWHYSGIIAFVLCSWIASCCRGSFCHELHSVVCSWLIFTGQIGVYLY